MDTVLKYVFSFYAVEVIVLIGVILFSWFLYDRRLHEKQDRNVPKGYNRTDEVSIDPTTGKKFRVFYNEDTGSRYYHEEK